VSRGRGFAHAAIVLNRRQSRPRPGAVKIPA
jgi:hypothetical protein